LTDSTILAGTTEPITECPALIRGPWSRQARAIVIERETREAFVQYFRKAVKVRNWTPWDDLPLQEIEAFGERLSPETVLLFEAFLGVEDYVGDYVQDAMQVVGKQRGRRNIMLEWGAEELKHAESWHLVLLASGARTEEQLDAYRDRVAQYTWRMGDDHPGLETPLGSAVYAMLQERATYHTYDELRRRVRREYGLPEDPTPEERSRGRQVGAAGALQIVGNDEIAHHGIFLKLVDIYRRYDPVATFETLHQVFHGFKMPALSLIPNAEEMFQVLERIEFYNPVRWVRTVYNPILDALGLENRRALDRAVQTAKLLPAEVSPLAVSWTRQGEWVLDTTPAHSTD
jgi:acyl-[acyl-carrier-protein] desaturase